MARRAGTTSQETEALIYGAALRLFAQYGYAAVSMRHIAGEVGVNQAALYHYTATKQDLLAGLLTRHMDELLAAWADQDVPKNPSEALDFFTRFHIRHHLPRRDEIFLSYMELRSLEEAHLERITAMRQDYEDILRSIINNGIAQNQFQALDPHVSAMAILAMLTGITTWYRQDGRLTPKQLEDLYSQLAMQAVGGKALIMETEPCLMPA